MTHPSKKFITKDDAALCDVAPTVLDLMGLPIPEEMTGNSLLNIAEADLVQLGESVTEKETVDTEKETLPLARPEWEEPRKVSDEAAYVDVA